MNGWRPIKVKGWTKLTVDELIGVINDKLYAYTKTRAYDSGHRAVGVEAYLQGLIDAKRLCRPSTALSPKTGAEQ